MANEPNTKERMKFVKMVNKRVENVCERALWTVLRFFGRDVAQLQLFLLSLVVMALSLGLLH